MLPRRNKLPELNNFHNLKHIVHDFHKSGMKDTEIVALAKSEGRIIVTKNIRHFGILCRQMNVDMVGVTETVLPEKLDRSIMAYLRKRQQRDMSGTVTRIVQTPRKR